MSLIPYSQIADAIHDHDHPDEVAMPGVVDAITDAPGYRIVAVGGSRIEIPDALEIGALIRVGDLVDVIIRRA